MEVIDLIHFYLKDGYILVFSVSPWLLIFLFLFLAFVVWKWKWWPRTRRWRFHLVKLDVKLGNVGKAEFRPNLEDIQVAHRIWTELVTRKAALPINPEHDVITEIYNSWYALFLRVRQLIGDIPGHLVRDEKSTQELIRIATDTLNLGLRPHLTQWQARFRNWYVQKEEELKTKTPQELQRNFPEYKLLMIDMQQVNQQIIQYAGELKKVIRGE